MVYVGALAALLDIELEVLETLFGEQYKGKEKLVPPTCEAVRAGPRLRPRALRLTRSPIRCERRGRARARSSWRATAPRRWAAVYGGATVCAWYPITPSSSLAEAFEKYCAKLRVDKATGRTASRIVQAEDELASIGIVVGAGWNGARAFTATSGPGISLMTEFIGLAYFAEMPVVLFNVQRGGPSTGMPTRTQQADILSCAYASHGDTKHVLLFPEDPRECFESRRRPSTSPTGCRRRCSS